MTLLARKSRDTSQAVFAPFPIFRTAKTNTSTPTTEPMDRVWFNLSARTVFGTLSEKLVADAELCRRTVFAVIAGTIAPALDLLPLHAGCIVRDGRAVLLAAASGVGKSTVTLALAMRGWSLLSDDWTFVGQDRQCLRAWAHADSLKLLPDAVNSLS